MDLINKIKNLVKKDKGIQQAVAFSQPYSPILSQMRQRDRIEKINKIREIANNDPRIARSLYKLASDTFVDELDFVIEEAINDKVKQNAREIISKLIERTGITQKALQWVLCMLRDGDVFLNLIFEDNKIAKIKSLATTITFSNLDEYGNFPEGKKAYYQVSINNPLEITTEFEEFEIVQLSWNRDDGEPYGKGIFFPVLNIYDRLALGERNIAIRRAMGAGNRLLHIIGTPDKPARIEQVEQYKNLNKDALDNPFEPFQHYYSNGLVDIKEISGDKEISNIDDIRYFETLLFTVAGIPQAFIGRDVDINRDVLEEQEEDYYRVIKNISNIFCLSMKKVFDTELLLNNILPESVKYRIITGYKDRDDLKDKVDLAVKLQSLGYSFETIFNVISLPSIKYEDEIKRIQDQIDNGFVPYGVNMKVDPNILALLDMIASNDRKLDDVLGKLETQETKRIKK